MANVALLLQIIAAQVYIVRVAYLVVGPVAARDVSDSPPTLYINNTLGFNKEQL